MEIDRREFVDDPIVSRAEERFFLQLFYNVLMLINGQRASDGEIWAGIEKIVAHFRDRGPADACAVINFRTLGDYLGYFYWSSPLSASVTRKKALAAFRNCPEFMTCFHRPSLKVISVGAGTGSDLVGLYSALYEGGCTFQNMEIILTDIKSQWLPYHNAVETCLRQNEFGNASRLIQSRRIVTSFVCADLSNTITVNLQQELGNSSLIWMKGLLSILRDDNERHRVTENIISSITPGTLFVVMDSLSYLNDIHSPRLQNIFSTNVGYNYVLVPFPDQGYRYRFCNKTNQEIIIFKRV